MTDDDDDDDDDDGNNDDDDEDGDDDDDDDDAALQAATILVAMASGKNIWRLQFWRKSPISDQQIKRETYLKNYQ